MGSSNNLKRVVPISRSILLPLLTKWKKRVKKCKRDWKNVNIKLKTLKGRKNKKWITLKRMETL